jgi:hypothetical protein
MKCLYLNLLLMVNSIKGILAMIIICACLPLAGHAQMNLVKNGDFEQKHNCPVSFTQIRTAKYWSSPDTSHVSGLGPYFGNPDCTPGYVHTCSPDPTALVPNNNQFYQYPRSGNGMISSLVYFHDSALLSPNNHREYAMTRLSSTLIAGQSYCVTFFIVRSNGVYGSYAIDGIGAYLDDGSIDTFTFCGMPHMGITPQVYATTILFDTLHWMRVQGNFIANGTEKYITLGNFFDTANTAEIRTGPHWLSYYQIDDVSVIATGTNAYAGPDVTMYEGDTAQIGVADSNGGGMPCWWYILGNSAPIDSTGTLYVHPADTTTYVVKMDLCGVVTYDTVTVNVVPCSSVNASFTDVGTNTVTFTYTGTTLMVDSMRWTFGDGATSTAMNPVHTYTASGTYKACVRIYTFCGMDSMCKDYPVGVIPLTPKGEPIIWPNPVSNELHVDGGAGSIFSVYDVVSGSARLTMTISRNNEVVSVSHLPRGIYIVQITEPSTGLRFVKKIIRE